MNSRTRTYLWAVLLALPLCALGCAKKDTPAATGGHAADADKEPFGRMTMEELDAKMALAKDGKASLAIIDNNPKDLFDQGHIPGAKWVKYDALAQSDLPADKDTTLVFYCANEH